MFDVIFQCGGELGFSAIHAELLPEQKAELLTKLKAHTKTPLTPGQFEVGDWGDRRDMAKFLEADMGIIICPSAAT